MLRYMLDTNIVIYVIKKRPLSALQVFNQEAGHMAISSITLAELLHGAEKSNAPARSLAVVEVRQHSQCAGKARTNHWHQ